MSAPIIEAIIPGALTDDALNALAGLLIQLSEETDFPCKRQRPASRQKMADRRQCQKKELSD